MSLLKWLQGIFFVVVSGATITSLWLSISNSRLAYQQTELLSTPTVGITGLETKRVIPPGKKDTYDNIKSAQIWVTIKNTGNVGVKNLTINFSWRIGNTTLPVTRSEQTQKGIDLLQGIATFHIIDVSKDIIERVIANKPEDRLVVTYDFSYSDWVGKKVYKYPTSLMLIVWIKEPLTFQAYPVANP